MGPEEARRYGFGMSREAHIAFVAVYLTVLLMVAGFGVLRFAATLPTWQFHWPAVPVAGVLVSAGYWRYRPAMHNGMPVAANVKVNVRFKLAN